MDVLTAHAVEEKAPPGVLKRKSLMLSACWGPQQC